MRIYLTMFSFKSRFLYFRSSSIYKSLLPITVIIIFITTSVVLNIFFFCYWNPFHWFTTNIIIFRFTETLVPLLFYFLKCLVLLLIPIFIVNIFYFSFYFWLNNFYSNTKLLRLVNRLLCLLSWNCRELIHYLIIFLQFP